MTYHCIPKKYQSSNVTKMIKKITRSLVLVFIVSFTTLAVAQPTLQTVNLPHVGDIWAYKTITDTTIQPGLTGTGVSWNFLSYFVSPTVFNAQHEAVGTTGNDASFPTANMKVTSTFGGYDYYIQSSSGLQYLGSKSSNLELIIANVQNLLTVPFAYGQTITNQPVTGTSVAGFLVTGSISATADATGTLQLTTGTTSNVLRVYYNIDLVVGAGTGVDTYVHLQRYCWYKVGLRAPVMIIESLNVDGGLGNSSQKSALVNVVTPTGLNELTPDFSFNIFPNPVKDKATISINVSNNSTGTLSITDITGKIWKQESVELSFAKNIQMDFSVLPKGIYFVSLESDGTKKEQRFIVE